ncbi:MAG TPA: coenzyme F420-0:L-glutamate ligase [Solirubrobacteraceae bacterium]|jgi:coenzyme F420-0:L-glutamate ligase/coenzyme F420-1:gamma-L-glutamate ligase|nr:coenzyme F420-0:L-glutamate ligase [Solirubrobacteraceae bacterium]
MASLSARALGGLPELRAGDDLGEIIAAAAGQDDLRDGQLLVIAHKVVSKAEGAVVSLAGVQPGARARELAGQARADGAGERDPRAIQVVLDQSAEILRADRGVLICRTHQGFVCANAGVDASNSADGETLVLLPPDPDRSARLLRARLRELTGASLGVLIADSFGRAWRHGQVDVAIGLAGMQPLDDWRGRRDARGLELRATWLAVADAAAAIGELARSKDSREPVILIDGLERFVGEQHGPGAVALLRPLEEDMFR